MYSRDRDPYKFKNCFSFLDKLSLEELRKTYEELYDPVKMVYYVDDDINKVNRIKKMPTII